MTKQPTTTGTQQEQEHERPKLERERLKDLSADAVADRVKGGKAECTKEDTGCI